MTKYSNSCLCESVLFKMEASSIKIEIVLNSCNNSYFNEDKKQDFMDVTCFLNFLWFGFILEIHCSWDSLFSFLRNKHTKRTKCAPFVRNSGTENATVSFS